MTKDEILEMAKKAGFLDPQIIFEPLEDFARLVAKKAFKAGFLAGWNESGEGFNSEYGCSTERVLEMCDEAIRARGQE
jgi:hypothetical protein